MRTNWNYQDIIDLEYFLQLDGDSLNKQLHQRDRDIFLTLADTAATGVEAARSADTPHHSPRAAGDSPTLLKMWLDARRRMTPTATTLPGSYASEAHILVRVALLLLGLFVGSSAGMAFLAYSGSTPVNVLNFLVLFVFSQLLMTGLLLSRGLVGRLGGSSARFSKSISIRLISVGANRLASWLLRRGNQQIDAKKRLAMQAALGRIQATGTMYKGLFYWPLFLLAQLFGISFNIGLLVATLLKITVSDLAFGWQSTLQFSAQSLHNFVSWLALPWSWLVSPPIGHPGLPEIEGSRIILKEGIANLQTPDLVSWWPFLLLSVLFYGLLVRLFCYGWGKLSAHRAEQRLKFDTPAIRQVLRRMTTPVVTTQAKPEPVAPITPIATEPNTAEFPKDEAQPLQPITLLLPDEIHDSCDPEQLAYIFEQEGFAIAESHRFMADYDSDQALLTSFRQAAWEGSAGITIIQESWMPPLVSFLSYLKEMRSAVGHLPIMIRLTGKPASGSTLTPVTDQLNLDVWQQKIESLGDPYIETRPLIES